MDPFFFSCPKCSIRLRVRDALSVGRQIDCPECGQLLRLTEGPGGLTVQLIASTAVSRESPGPKGTVGTSPDASAARHDTVATTPAAPRAEGGQLAPVPDASVSGNPTAWWQRRSAISGAVVIAVLLVAGVWFSRSRESFDPISSGLSAVDTIPPAETGPEVPPNGADIGPGAELATLSERFDNLSNSIRTELESSGMFPAGTVPSPNLPVEGRLSWLAVLADRTTDNHPPVDWDRAWNDPVNDPFVRRRLVPFQNPAVRALTGSDGYPATHFVGVAGVGADASRLDTRDPRAGVFGDERRVRLEDIRDGAANTWLVLGVHEQLGSWGAGGSPTVRPLAREPYVNGPDGFGTGQPDAMFVLLADGRVQTVSASADPAVLRAQATIADGAPGRDASDGTDRGDEPPDLSIASNSLPMNVETPEEADPPLEPEFADEPRIRAVDIAESLRQPILKYEQARPRPLTELLPGLSELVGVPIRIDPGDPELTGQRLRTPVSLKLGSTTVGAILEGLLKPAGLTYRVEADHLQLVPRAP
jgi:hypothetical protein